MVVTNTVMDRIILQKQRNPRDKIAIIGLGYVGLPLAVALARHDSVTGFDINNKRIDELKQNFDHTSEITSEELQLSSLEYTTKTQDLKDHNIFIITVPTPITQDLRPDLTAIKSAARMVGEAMSAGAIVVFESTVYPGVTEDICGPILEQASDLKAGQDFYLGYSPERINPGDKEHTVSNIVKVVAGQTPAVANKLAKVYGQINNNQIHIAPTIKTAEAAKVIENAQRDINIAFMNEITMIFNKGGLSTHDVLAAAQTKWNFLPFKPGLVGGHCIGVDPYYLAAYAKDKGHNPEVILSGRRINDHMGQFLGDQIHDRLKETLVYGRQANILVLGITFKEDVPDLRNSKVVDLVRRLEQYGHQVKVHDPLANVEETQQLYNIKLLSSWQEVLQEGGQQTYAMASGSDISVELEGAHGYDCLIGAVPHKSYSAKGTINFEELLTSNGLIVDLKGIWSDQPVSKNQTYWKL